MEEITSESWKMKKLNVVHSIVDLRMRKHSEVILTENLSSVERAAQWNPRLVRQRSNGGRARQADVCHRAGDLLARIKLKSTANL